MAGGWGYIENNFTLKKISTGGGVPVTVAGRFDGPSRGAAWGPDDTFVFATGAPETGLQRVASAGGAVTVLTRPDRARGEEDHVKPAWLPGRPARALHDPAPQEGGPMQRRSRCSISRPGSCARCSRAVTRARYVESGYIVYAAAGALWATRFNLPRLETEGSPAEVVRPVIVGTSEPPSRSISPAMARWPTRAAQPPAIGSFRFGSTGRGVRRRCRPSPASIGISGFLQTASGSPSIPLEAVRETSTSGTWQVPGPRRLRMTPHPAMTGFRSGHLTDERSCSAPGAQGGFSNLYLLDLESGSTKRLTDSPDMQCRPP